MSFHEVRFPVALSFGSSGGPERRTEIVTLTNGFEERNTPWEHSRRRYDAGIGLRSLADLEAVIAFFEARRGQLYGFRWKDWADWTSGGHGRSPMPADQPIGTGDGAPAASSCPRPTRMPPAATAGRSASRSRAASASRSTARRSSAAGRPIRPPGR